VRATKTRETVWHGNASGTTAGSVTFTGLPPGPPTPLYPGSSGRVDTVVTFDAAYSAAAVSLTVAMDGETKTYTVTVTRAT